MWLSILIIAVLILLNGLFVAAEFAIIGVSRSALEFQAAQGKRRAQLVLSVLQDPQKQDRYIATAQLGITFASLGLGMYGEHQLAQALVGPFTRWGLDAWVPVPVVSSVLAVGFLTYLHIVLGEMIPKTLALQHAESTAIWISSPMRWAKRLLFPFVVLLNWLGILLLRLFGVRRELAHTSPTPETLRYIIEESVSQGGLEAEAGQVLEELFEFGELTAGEVMTPRVQLVGLPRGASCAEIRALVQEERHGRYPVYEETLDKILGIVLIRDLLRHLISDTPLSDASIRPVPFVPETARLDTVLNRMRKEKTHMVVVMDEYGGTAGILTIEDLFEEIVGEFSDGPSPGQPIEQVGDRYRISGLLRLDQLGEHLGLSLEHPDVDTVTGLILSLLGRPPLVGDTVIYNGVLLEVLTLHGHGVEECWLSLVAPPLTPEEDQEQEQSARPSDPPQ